MVKVYIEKDNKNIELEFNGKIIDLAKSLNVNIETVICVLNESVVNENTNIKNSDNIQFLSVISGG
ncbi:hypothetical protein HOK68_05005 [Candidatus Woesearchaeota archaeon]|jgi:sulfur carrier protein ThiS|nr:hypothetical protein [Candidatus Woesearchaeota archaeon]MBT4387325.1 hypothetical protein [Candidatus Woesearchaeota archaeon]MBT4595464.1 hypothetical protein [Candidatus Woesearchaeota archaeon]MBT5740661.1 hypothetical protein [Candidatus Woesearchaeota archaeon]MBT6506107.1 hypothetical protein [Candidatus Woesearchaeota archaeon]